MNNRGSVTTKFTSVLMHDDGTLLLKGRFRLNSSEEIWFFLREQTRPLVELVSQFESLGDNCEFGFVQRYFGIEQLGLFRFNWIDLGKLVAGIQNGFKGLDSQDNIYCEAHNASGEFLIHDHLYGSCYHSGKHINQVDEAQLLRDEAKRLGFLRRKLFDDLRSGEKIMVRKGFDSRFHSQILPLYHALHEHGDATLLWVVETEASDLIGTVERIDTRLLRGYIGRFAPYTYAKEIAADNWGRLCKAGYREVYF